VRGSVAEVGAGIGTFSERILGGGADRLVLVEPDPACAAVLDERFAGDERVAVAREQLPAAPSLKAGGLDLVVCQNVLEHIEDDRAAVAAMSAALAPGGELALLVPANPRLFGALDEAYGHYRRYTPEGLRELVQDAGLEVIAIHPFNALGIAGWWWKNRRPDARIGRRSLALYEALVRLWRPLERLLRPRWGLSLVVRARRPERP
jgi:SAM-dependent methyltransferase